MTALTITSMAKIFGNKSENSDLPLIRNPSPI